MGRVELKMTAVEPQLDALISRWRNVWIPPATFLSPSLFATCNAIFWKLRINILGLQVVPISREATRRNFLSSIREIKIYCWEWIDTEAEAIDLRNNKNPLDEPVLAIFLSLMFQLKVFKWKLRSYVGFVKGMKGIFPNVYLAGRKVWLLLFELLYHSADLKVFTYMNFWEHTLDFCF